MFRTLATVLAAAAAVLQWSAPTSAQGRAASPVRASHPVLQASLARIAAGSPLWRDALDAVAPTGRHVVVLTADQVVVADQGTKAPGRFDAGVLAEAAPVPVEGGRVDVAMVVVNLALLEDSHRSRHCLPWEFTDDLDRLLIHEIYGHALPYLLAGHVSGRCADPRPDERPTDACAIRRENAVRSELGLGRRKDSGLDGLALMRPSLR
jgi:hypothetical protein